MVRSIRTGTLIFDPEVEKTARRLRKEAQARKKTATSSNQVNIETHSETDSDEGIEEVEEIMDQPPPGLKPQQNQQNQQQPQDQNFPQHEENLNNLQNLDLNLNINHEPPQQNQGQPPIHNQVFPWKFAQPKPSQESSSWE